MIAERFVRRIVVCLTFLAGLVIADAALAGTNQVPAPATAVRAMPRAGVDVSDEIVAANGIGKQVRDPLPAPPVVNLQDDLDQIVALNNGFGGGVFRVTSRTWGLLWEGASGNTFQNGTPIPTDATFEIASTSKAFTAATVLLLMEDGLLTLDQPIGELLPPEYTTGLIVIDNHDYTPELTVRQILSHTSGLPDYWNDPPYILPGVNAFLFAYILSPQRFWTPDNILAYVPGLDPIFVPGTGWHYSDTGYLLAGLIIEELTGKQLHEVYRDRIFNPLGINDTWLHWRESPVSGLTESHRYEGTWDMYDKQHNSADWAGGGLVSSIRDLETFIRALADSSLFSDPATIDEMTNWIGTGTPWVQYGLGLFRTWLDNGQGEIWGHDGYGNSWMYYWPDHDVTMVGTLNQTSNDWWPLVNAAALQIDSGYTVRKP